jgi:hypothetical protein
MALQSSGAISFDNLRTEYGNGGSIALSEMYRGGAFVLDHSNNSGVPTSGTISLSNFYSQNNTSPVVTWTMTQTNGSSGGKLPLIGYSDGLSGSFGSVSDNSIDFLSKTYKALWHRVAGVEVGTHFQIQDNSTAWTSITIAGTTIARTSFSTGANGEFWLDSSTNYVGSNGQQITIVMTQ